MADDNRSTEEDILELNKQQPTSSSTATTEQVQEDKPTGGDIDLDNILENQEDKAKAFDISKFHGMDMERLNAYFGTVGDSNNQIQIALSQLSKFVIPYNRSGDPIFADWSRMELEYQSVTTVALNKRQALNAQVEDLGRLVQTTQLKIQTKQIEIRERQNRQYSARQSNDLSYTRSDKVTLNNIRVEELQKDIRELDEIPLNISSELQSKKEEANWLGAQMYFHVRDRQVFDNMRADHLDNILKACDLKQLGIPKNQGTSSNSPIAVRQGVS